MVFKTTQSLHGLQLQIDTSKAIMHICRRRTDAKPGHLVLVRSRADEEVAQVKLQVRRVDQTRYPMIVVASLSAVPQSCRTPLLKKQKNQRNPTGSL